jgi:hypothetical protein
MNRTFAVILGFQLVMANLASAQADSAPAEGTRPLSAEQQIASAVLAAPDSMRAGATVLGYAADGHLTTLRKGRGELICLASDPKSDQFHVACYHKSLEPFMARGRALRAHGVTGDKVDSVRFAEIRKGKLRLPNHPALLYSLTGPAGSYDPNAGTASGAKPLFVIYVPFATQQSTGLSAVPIEGGPWIMDPGTPKAHVMFEPRM